MEFSFQRSYRGPLKAILLDWAGTTMDYGCYAPAVVFVQVYERKGVPISVEEARVPMGAHKKVHIRKISQLDSVRDRWFQAHGRVPEEQDVQAMFDDFVPLQMNVLADYADLIPGTLDAVADFRARGLKIGSTTGYTREMMGLLQSEAAKRGYEPDSTVCATDVPEGRPAPFMCLQNMINLQVYPPEAIVKVDDTIPGIEEGLNAGMWTIGLAKTGNEIGLNAQEIAKLGPAELKSKLERAYNRMAQAGAHFVVDGIWDVPAVLDEIAARVRRGERP
ncbi:MAG: phosphonoacetaldehyde hydrolase [Anaerolineae bacterium]|nr:phosphonoacetaldehyde hydrolase [Anaerolineae bacterium]